MDMINNSVGTSSSLTELSFTGGSSGSSPVTSSGGAPSPLNSFLSPPPCSSPTFYLPTSSLGMPCPEMYLHSINLPLCYKICPTDCWRQQPLVLTAAENLASSSSSQSLSPLMMEVANSKNSSSTEVNGKCLPEPNSSSQILYGLQAPGNILSPNLIARETIHCSFRPSFGFYRYNFTMPSRMANASSHPTMNDNTQISFEEVKCNHVHWYPTINHCF